MKAREKLQKDLETADKAVSDAEEKLAHTNRQLRDVPLEIQAEQERVSLEILNGVDPEIAGSKLVSLENKLRNLQAARNQALKFRDEAVAKVKQARKAVDFEEYQELLAVIDEEVGKFLRVFSTSMSEIGEVKKVMDRAFTLRSLHPDFEFTSRNLALGGWMSTMQGFFNQQLLEFEKNNPEFFKQSGAESMIEKIAKMTIPPSE